MAFGVIPQKGGLYALRIVGSCGRFTAAEVAKVAELAARFGSGHLTATSRGTFELEGVTENELEAAVAAVQTAGLRLGGTGGTVRAVVACKGSSCRRGMFDVHKLACRIDARFYGIEVPKKFKIGVFGCKNSLGKAMAQDVGIMPSFSSLGKYEIYVGGLLGNSPVQGKNIAIPLTEEQLLAAVDFIIDLYKEHGVYPQRLRAVLEQKPALWEQISCYCQNLTEKQA